jgi:hypothetical protein
MDSGDQSALQRRLFSWPWYHLPEPCRLLEQGAQSQWAWKVVLRRLRLMYLYAGAVTQWGLWNWRGSVSFLLGPDICSSSFLLLLLTPRVQVHFSDDSCHKQCSPYGGHE